MTRLTDGKRTVEITINEWAGNGWTGNGWTPDWSSDFFATGALPYDAEKDAYVVKDVYWCVGQAVDWKKAQGDFYDPDADTKSRDVDIDFK